MKGVDDTTEAEVPAPRSLEYLVDRVLDLATMPAALIYLYACRAEDADEAEREDKRPRPIAEEADADRPLWGVEDYADAG